MSAAARSVVIVAVAVAAVAAASSLLASCETPRAAGNAAHAPSEPPVAGAFHTVEAGETLFDIARDSGLSASEIAEVNGLPLEEGAGLAPGLVLFLPATGPRPPHAPKEPIAPSDAAPATSTTSPSSSSAAALAWPLDGVVLRDFQPRAKAGRAFDGLLIAAPFGAPVRAAADGEVIFIGETPASQGLGLFALVRHDAAATEAKGDAAVTSLITVYAHLDKANVKVGDHVVRGAAIGVVGTSGGQESPRLYFEVRRGRTPVDPLPLLPP